MGLVLGFTLTTQYINAYFHTAFELFMSGAGTIKKKQKKTTRCWKIRLW